MARIEIDFMSELEGEAFTVEGVTIEVRGWLRECVEHSDKVTGIDVLELKGPGGGASVVRLECDDPDVIADMLKVYTGGDLDTALEIACACLVIDARQSA